MKKINILFLIVIISTLQSCCLILDTGCDDCEDVLQGVELADLLLEDFESVLVPDANSNSTAYDIIHTVTNFASEFDCPDSVSDADMHMDQLKLVYSDTEDFNNPIVVETKNAIVNQTTIANENYSVVSNIEFTTAGFYILDNSIDESNDVSERNESNNNDICGLGVSDCNNSNSRRSNAYALDNIIHITKKMVSNKSKSNAKQDFISKWEIEIR